MNSLIASEKFRNMLLVQTGNCKSSNWIYSSLLTVSTMRKQRKHFFFTNIPTEIYQLIQDLVALVKLKEEITNSLIIEQLQSWFSVLGYSIVTPPVIISKSFLNSIFLISLGLLYNNNNNNNNNIGITSYKRTESHTRPHTAHTHSHMRTRYSSHYTPHPQGGVDNKYGMTQGL